MRDPKWKFPPIHWCKQNQKQKLIFQWKSLLFLFEENAKSEWTHFFEYRTVNAWPEVKSDIDKLNRQVEINFNSNSSEKTAAYTNECLFVFFRCQKQTSLFSRQISIVKEAKRMFNVVNHNALQFACVLVEKNSKKCYSPWKKDKQNQRRIFLRNKK